MTALVMKFGGTSVGSNPALEHVLNIVRQEKTRVGRVIVVSSAMSGVTDFLVKLVDNSVQGNLPAIDEQIEALRTKHHSVLEHWLKAHPYEWHLVDEQLETLYAQLKASSERIREAGQADAQSRDAVLSMGERLMVRVVAAILRANAIPAQAIDASDFLITDDCYQNAQPLFDISAPKARQHLFPLLDQNIVPIVTGYIGSTLDGAITTLGRGGSDYSATYLAGLIDADEVWIWTDVNGVMSGDPRKLKNAQIIPNLTYHAVSEFAHFGAKVLHPRAVEPLISLKIPLRVCNTFNPDYIGTFIKNQEVDSPKFLNAVTDIQGVLVFAPTISPDIASKFSAPPIQMLAESILRGIVHQVVSPVITVDSNTGRLLCYVIPTTARRTATEESVQAIYAALSEAYPGIAWRVEPVAIVAAIGVVDVQQTMQVLNAVRSVKADLLAMGQGSPECALLIVPPGHAMRVVKRLHNMAVSAHNRLGIMDEDPLCPPMPDLPNNRKRKTTKPKSGVRPPNRSIPLY